jgi:hypothetical protein
MNLMKIVRTHWNIHDFTLQDINRRKTCVRKRQYLSDEMAEKMCAKRDIPLRVYKCPYCLYFHITKKDRGE